MSQFWAVFGQQGKMSVLGGINYLCLARSAHLPKGLYIFTLFHYEW